MLKDTLGSSLERNQQDLLPKPWACPTLDCKLKIAAQSQAVINGHALRTNVDKWFFRSFS